MGSIREVTEGIQTQGEDETIIYAITTTNWASSPTSPTMVVKDISNDSADVTSTVTSGSMSVNGDVVTLKAISGLTADHRYRVEVKFTVGSNIFEPYFLIYAEV